MEPNLYVSRTLLLLHVIRFNLRIIISNLENKRMSKLFHMFAKRIKFATKVIVKVIESFKHTSI